MPSPTLDFHSAFHLAQVVREDEAGAGTVSAANRSDQGVWQSHARVERLMAGSLQLLILPR